MINSIVVYDKIAECLSVSTEFVKLSKNDAILTPSQAVAVFASLFEISGVKTHALHIDVKAMILASVLRALGVKSDAYSNQSRSNDNSVVPRIYASIIMIKDYAIVAHKSCKIYVMTSLVNQSLIKCSPCYLSCLLLFNQFPNK